LNLTSATNLLPWLAKKKFLKLLGAHVRALREAKELTQTALSAKMDKDAQACSVWSEAQSIHKYFTCMNLLRHLILILQKFLSSKNNC